MITQAIRRAGALAKARKIRNAYIANPNNCLHCSIQILPKSDSQPLSAVRKKRFCSQSCNALNRHITGRNPNFKTRPRPKRGKTCSICNTTISINRTYCSGCWEGIQVQIEGKTKGEYGSRNIRNHARYKLLKYRSDRQCVECSYFHHVEACHIIPIAGFPNDALIGEINALKNLVWLCPNHHWEFDHGRLILKKS